VLFNTSVLTASEGAIRDKKNKNRRLVVSRHWLASAALGHSRDGGIEQRNFDSYTPMRMSQIHEIDVSIIGNGEPAVMGSRSATPSSMREARACARCRSPPVR
jgi:hypothetical protein